jgi:hypothetical protein
MQSRGDRRPGDILERSPSPRSCTSGLRFSSEAVVQRRVRCAMEVALWQRCVGSGYAREPGLIDMLAAMWNALGWEPDHG